MSIAERHHWLETPEGDAILAWERARIDAMVADLFGFNALQIGHSDLDLLRANRIPYRHRCESPEAWLTAQVPEADAGVSRSLCDFHALPFASNSMDLVLMPHVLEFAADPHQVLREVERILIPEGRLILFGFNPFSLWGLARQLPQWHNNKQRAAGAAARPRYPFDGQFIAVPRLKDWLQLLGMEIERGAFGAYLPPGLSPAWQHRLHFLDAAGDRWWGFAGGVYLLQAVKHVCSMHLITPNWRNKSPPLRAFKPATSSQRQTSERVIREGRAD